MKKINKAEAWRALKFFLFSCSAGLIQLAVTEILNLIWPVDKFSMGPMVFYIIGLVCSVIYNVTVNRKWTFKSANNYTIALLETIGFYIVFTPLSALLQAWLTNGDIFGVWKIPYLGLHTLLGTFICMFINLVLEFPFQRYVVFRKSIDTNKKALKQKEQEDVNY